MGIQSNVKQFQKKAERIKLTDKLIEGLKSRAKDYSVKDDAVSELSVRVRISGNRAFYVQKGQKKKKIADCALMTVSEARREAVKLLALGLDSKHVVKPVPSFYEAVERYKTSRAFAKGYISNVNQVLRVFKAIRNKPVNEVSREFFKKRLLTAINNEEFTDATLDSVINVTSAVYGYQVADEAIVDNPLIGIRKVLPKLNINVRQQRLHTQEHFRAFQYWYWSTKQGDGVSPQNTKDFEMVKDVCLFMLLTGLRVNEVLKLKWCDVWMNEGKELSLEGSILPRAMTVRDTKNKSDHTLQLTALMNALIFKQPTKELEYVFKAVSKGKQITDNAMYARVHKGLDSLLIDGKAFTPHSFRRTFAHWCAQSANKPDDVKIVMNHKDSSVTESYIGQQVQRTFKILQRYEGLIQKFFYVDDASGRHSGFGLLVDGADLAFTPKEELAYSQDKASNSFDNYYF